jgi:hypothetical protein
MPGCAVVVWVFVLFLFAVIRTIAGSAKEPQT